MRNPRVQLSHSKIVNTTLQTEVGTRPVCRFSKQVAKTSWISSKPEGGIRRVQGMATESVRLSLKRPILGSGCFLSRRLGWCQLSPLKSNLVAEGVSMTQFGHLNMWPLMNDCHSIILCYLT